MQSLSSHSRTSVESLAEETGFSTEAVQSMLRSVSAGGGGMAQFSHPEFGGSGQWMRGGMLMISNPSDRALKGRIERLCDALAEGIAAEPTSSAGGSFQTQSQTTEGFTRVQDSRDPAGAERTVRGDSSTAAGTLFDRQGGDRGTWYPASLGTPNSSGSQNGSRYAWFADTRRLAIDDGHGVRVYDTGEHRIGGVSQQQGSRGSVSFVSQLGTVDVESLPVATADEAPSRPQDAGTARDDEPQAPAAATASASDSGDDEGASRDPFVALEKLAGLHARGIVGDDEFAAKKAELLKRI